ncbi:MAG: metallophosphoesterase [Methanococcoides sp.]|nr:metallophosphoesterase [Methanococcoides sp.]
MTDIRYVCISDLHLGEEDSILTALSKSGVDTNNPGPVMVELIRCLKELISKNEGDRKPTLILNGDIVELALSTTEISAMVFERFRELFREEGEEELFDQIIYVPGNHDHHLWERTRETQYLGYIKRHPERKLPAPWHKTEMFMKETDNLPHCDFLESLLNRHSSDEDPTFARDLKILVAYPNLGLRSENSDRCIVIHHGHFVESKYRLMSRLKADIFGVNKEMPEDIQELEAENFAWIEFLWSAIGRSGDVGEEVETLYEHMHNSEHMKKYISKMAEKLAKRYDLPGPEDWVEKKIMQTIIEWAFDQFSKGEREVRSTTMGEETEKGISLYLNTTWNQIKEECNGWTPSELVFVFGHTHKPCEEHVSMDWLNGNVPVYNTGGWVVDTVDPQAVFGGSVVLIDDELNLASLRMYNEELRPGTCRVRVKAVDENGKENPLYDRICSLVDCEENEEEKGPWKQFSSEASHAVRERAERLEKRLGRL